MTDSSFPLVRSGTTATPASHAPTHPADVLERATAGEPVSFDEFARHQTAALRILDLTEDDAVAWHDTLTAAETRDVIELLNSIESEHRRRAEAVTVIRQRIRTHLHESANHADTDRPQTTRG